jgi:NitT/TauT family transport system permease protein
MMARRMRSLLPPILWGVLFLVAWEQFVKWRRIKPYLLSPPSRIWAWLKLNRRFVIQAAKVTGMNAFIGLVLGALLGIAVALVCQRFRSARHLITPLSAALNTMPIVALGPVFYNMFGTTSDIARRAVVALVVFFPVFVNVLKGLTQVDPIHEELMRSYAAGDAQMLRRVRVPNAMPFLLTGLRLAASLAVIAAVVVEYFGGPQSGLGQKTASAMKQSLTANGWAYIFAACLLGLAFYAAALVLERVAMPWQVRRAAQ